MRRIILASHGFLADGCKSSIDMIAGKQDCVAAFCLKPGSHPDTVLEDVKRYVQEYDIDEIIMISDFPGGSINTKLTTLCEDERLYLISGMNLMLVLDLVLSDETISTQEAIDKALINAKATIRDVKKEMKAEEDEGGFFDD